MAKNNNSVSPTAATRGTAMSFWSEVKRRNVFKVGVAYAVVGWLLVQAAAIALPAFRAPAWLLPASIFFIVLGFPVALLLAWAYELTPTGIRPMRASAVSRQRLERVPKLPGSSTPAIAGALGHDAAPPDLETELEGFEIVRRLGSSNMGHAFLAREIALQRLVVAKIMEPALRSDAVAVQRFERGARAAARLSHPNIARIYRIGQSRTDVPFLIEEFVDGHDLAELIRIEGRLPLARGLRVIVELADALAAADRMGIIHRDIQPEHVLIERDSGRTVLTDFGAVGLKETGGGVPKLTAVGEVLGNPRYVSPEHLRGDALTPQSDVYSLGVLAYELVAGRGPYDHAGLSDPSQAHLRCEPQDILELVPDLQLDCARILSRCLAKPPTERPTAAELAAVLRARVGEAGA